MDKLTRNPAPQVCLRPFVPADRAAMLELLTDAAVAKTYMLPLFESEAQVQALFERLQQFSAEPDRFVYGIYLQNRFIGLINNESNSVSLISGNAIFSGSPGKPAPQPISITFAPSGIRVYFSGYKESIKCFEQISASVLRAVTLV